MTTICCISDCHLGYRHRMKVQRLRDYEKAFLEAIRKAMELNPEIVVFCGDIFHHPRPDPKSMQTVIQNFMKIAESAKIVLCIGNHDIEGHLGTSYTPLFPEIHKNIHILTTETPHITLRINGKSIGVHGFEFLRDKKLAEEKLERISDEISGNDINILCIHQGIEHYLDPFEISLQSLRNVAPRYNLMLIGHSHKHQRIREVFDITPAYCIGSTERISFNEWKNDNGFLVFRDLDFRNPEFVKVNSAEMVRISENLGKKTPDEINSYIEKLIRENSGKKCLQINLDVNVEGDYLDILHDWEERYSEFEILDVNVAPKINSEEIRIDKLQIDTGIIREYFEKSGMKDRTELLELCEKLFERYG